MHSYFSFLPINFLTKTLTVTLAISHLFFAPMTFAKTPSSCEPFEIKTFNTYSVKSTDQVYMQLNSLFKFPSFFGNNKDALFDFLTTDFDKSYTIVCENTDLLSSNQAAIIYDVLSVIEVAQQEYNACVQLDPDTCNSIKSKASSINSGVNSAVNSGINSDGSNTTNSKISCVQDCLAAFDKPGPQLKACVSACK